MKASCFFATTIVVALMALATSRVNAAFVVTLTDEHNIDGDLPELGDLEAVLKFNGSGTSAWSVELSNNSPLFLNDNDALTSPAITGFGFSINPDSVAISSWMLSAFDIAGNSVVIGSSVLSEVDEPFASQGQWELDDSNFITGKLKFDFNPVTQTGIPGALYNPDHIDEINDSGTTVLTGGDPLAFTKAVLSITFSDATALVVDDPNSPVAVKFQNVGEGGEESAKLVGGVITQPPDDIPTPVVPEPSSVLLLTLGAVGTLGYRFRHRRNELAA